MKSLRIALLAAGMLIAGGLASTAAAKTVIITDVETGNGNLGNVSVPGFGTPWTTPILMTDSHGNVQVVFCDDLNHDVNVGGGQHLLYKIGLVTVDGNGNPLSEAISNEMGQLADLGKYEYSKGDEDGAIAAQAAIWGLEYGVVPTSTDTTIESFITNDLGVKDNHRGYATGLISLSGVQAQITGGVPEPTIWAMMLVGFGAMGLALRGSRRGLAAAV